MSSALHHFKKMYKGLSSVLLAVIQLLRPTWSKNVRMELKNSDKIYDYWALCHETSSAVHGKKRKKYRSLRLTEDDVVSEFWRFTF